MTKALLSFFMMIVCLSCSSSKNKNVISQRELDDPRKNLELDQSVENKFIVKEKTNIKTVEIKKVKPKKRVVLEKKAKNKVLEKSNYPVDYPEKYKSYDKKFQKTWKSFDPEYIKAGESIKMRVSYLGLGMGSMELNIKPDVLVGEKDAYSFSARLKTAAFYSYIYELDDSLVAHVEKEEFLPLKYELIQKESKKEIDDIQLFDQEKKMLYYRYRKWRKDKKTLTKRKDDIFIPKYSIDPFSLLYFVRGLPLETGRDFSFPIVTRNKLWVVKVVVGKKETISTINGKRSVYKVTAQIDEGGSFIKKGAIELWFDTAPGHLLWKLKVGTKIGALFAKVEELNSP